MCETRYTSFYESSCSHMTNSPIFLWANFMLITLSSHCCTKNTNGSKCPKVTMVSLLSLLFVSNTTINNYYELALKLPYNSGRSAGWFSDKLNSNDCVVKCLRKMCPFPSLPQFVCVLCKVQARLQPNLWGLREINALHLKKTQANTQITSKWRKHHV